MGSTRQHSAISVRRRSARHALRSPRAASTPSAGSRARLVAFVSSARPVTAPIATAEAGVMPRRRMRTPSQARMDHSAMSAPSTLTEEVTNIAMGHSPVVAAQSSWGTRRRPKSSPASSQAPTVVTSIMSAETTRAAYRRS